MLLSRPQSLNFDVASTRGRRLAMSRFRSFVMRHVSVQDGFVPGLEILRAPLIYKRRSTQNGGRVTFGLRDSHCIIFFNAIQIL